MTAPMHQSAYLYSGSLYSPTGRIVETPSVLVDPGMDMILTWGEPEYVQREFNRIDSAAPNLAKNLEIIELSGLTKPQACYVIRRMMEFTARPRCPGSPSRPQTDSQTERKKEVT